MQPPDKSSPSLALVTIPGFFIACSLQPHELADILVRHAHLNKG